MGWTQNSVQSSYVPYCQPNSFLGLQKRISTGCVNRFKPFLWTGYRREIMNWTTILADESRKNSLLRLDDLAREYNLQEIVARNAKTRYSACQKKVRVRFRYLVFV